MAQACEWLEQAERLHRQFFRLGAPVGARTVWEPPIDVIEDEDWITIFVALPGVEPHSVEVSMDPSGLLVRAERRLPLDDRDCVIRQLEIPHGHFERRIDLPQTRLEPARREWVNGCLVLELRKIR